MTELPHAASTATTAVSDHQRIRFTRDEIPRLVGMFGFILALHVLGWGLFIHYNSVPKLHNLIDSAGTLVYAVRAPWPTPSGYVTPSTPTTSPPSMTPPAICCRRGSGRWPSASSSPWAIPPSCSPS